MSSTIRRMFCLRASVVHSTVIALLATAGCAPTEALIASPEDWAVVAPEQDPWPGGATQAPCPLGAGQVEEGFFEIDLNACGWVTAQATTRERIRAGQELTALIFHSTLTSDVPATATLGLMAGDTELWRLEIPIPAANDFYEVAVPIADGLPPDTALHWHVHNHGANSYRIGPVRSRNPS